MAGMPTSTDAADWREADPATPVSDFDMEGEAPAAKAEQDLSPEDAAWVDSCLVKDGGNGPAGGEGGSESQSGDAWATLTEAFIDALAYSASGNATPTATEEKGKKKVEESLAHVNGGGGGEASGVDASGDELMTYEAEHTVTGEQASSPTASAYEATFCDQASPTLDDSLTGEGPSDQFEGTGEGNTSSSSSSSDGGQDAAAVIIGNECRDEQEGYEDGEDEFSIQAGDEVGEVELTGDIFRVWELDVTEEDVDEDEDEGEFGRQLKRALEGSSAGGGTVGTPLPADNDSGAAVLDAEEWRTTAVALDDENLEELIAGISDISLGRPPSSD